MHSQPLGTSKVTAAFHCHNEKLYSIAGTLKESEIEFISFSYHRTELHSDLDSSSFPILLPPPAHRMLYPIHGKEVTRNLQVPYLLISHWLDFAHVMTLAAKEAGKCSF